MPNLFTSALALRSAFSPSFSRPAASPLSVFDFGATRAASGFGLPMRPESDSVSPPASQPVRVMVVDSDADCLRRFASAIGADPRLQLLATADDAQAAMASLSRQQPEVLIVEPAMAHNFGTALIRHCAARLPHTAILVRTQVGDDEKVLAAIEAGASGFVYRDAAPEWIVASVHALCDGGALISPGVARRVLARFQLRVVVTSGFSSLEAVAEDQHAVLSPAEIGILRLVACGTGVHEIGEVLALPPHSVLAQVKAIYRKLGARHAGPGA